MLVKNTLLTCSLVLLASSSLMASSDSSMDEAEIEATVARIEAAAQDESADVNAADSLGEEAVAAVAESQAESVEMMARASCEIHIGTLTRSGNTLTGRGSQANCGPKGTSYLTMQRSRWYGWEDLKTVKIVGPGENYVKYNCAGTGKHEFRVIHTARTVGNKPLFKESAHHTWNCGN